MLKAFRKIRVEDKDLEQVQSNIGNSLVPILKSPIVDGNLVTNEWLVSGVQRVPHGLGRVPLGWIICDRSTTATLHRNFSNITDSTNISLVASAAGVFTIWFF